MGKKHVRLGVDLEGVKNLKGFLAYNDAEIISEFRKNNSQIKNDDTARAYIQIYFLSKKNNEKIQFSDDEKKTYKSVEGYFNDYKRHYKHTDATLKFLQSQGTVKSISDKNKTQIEQIADVFANKAENIDNNLDDNSEIEGALEKIQKELDAENQNENSLKDYVKGLDDDLDLYLDGFNDLKEDKKDNMFLNDAVVLDKKDLEAPAEEVKAPEEPKEDPYAEKKKEINDKAKTISDTLNKHKLSKYGVEVARIAELSAEADTEENLKKFKDGLDKYKNVLDSIYAAWDENTGAKPGDVEKLQEEAKKLATEINTYLSSKVNSNNDAIRENRVNQKNQKKQENWTVIDVAEKNKIVADFNADNNFLKSVEEKAAKQKAKNNDLKAEINNIDEPVKEEKEMPGKNNEKESKKEAYKVNPNNIIAEQNEVQINAVPKQPMAEQNVENVEQKPEDKVELEKAPEVESYAKEKKEINDLAQSIINRLDSYKETQGSIGQIKKIAKRSAEADSRKKDTEQYLENFKKGLNEFSEALKPIEKKLKSKQDLGNNDYDTLQKEVSKLVALEIKNAELNPAEHVYIDVSGNKEAIKGQNEPVVKQEQPEVKPAEAPKHEAQNEISKANDMHIDAEKKPEADQKAEPKQEKEVDPEKLEQVINNYEKAQNDFANKNNIIAAKHLLKNRLELDDEDMAELQDAYDKQSESEKELRSLLPEKLDADKHISIPDLIKNQMRLEEGRLSPQEKKEHYQNILDLKDQDGDKYSKQLMDYRQKIAKEAGKEFDKKHQDPAKLSFLNKSANAIEKVMCAMCKNPLGIGILLVAAINFPMMIIGLLAFTAWKRKRPDPAYQRAWKEQNQRELEAKRQQMAKTYNCNPSELSDREVTKALKADYVNDKVMEALDEKLEKDSKKLVDKTTKNYAKEISKESGEKFRARDLKDLARKEINPRRGLLDLDTNREARLRDNINKKERVHGL